MEGQPSTGVELDDFTRRKGKPRPLPRRTADENLRQTRELVTKKDWKAFTAMNLVWLYAHLHEATYGVLPMELLEPGVHKQALFAAGRLKQQMGTEGALSFLRWTWQREQRQFPQRQTDWRIGWRYQFRSAQLQTDFRVAIVNQRNADQNRKTQGHPR